MKFPVFICLCLIGMGQLLAQSASSATELPAFFEGTIEYKVSMDGSEKDILMENEPNTQMAMHVKDGSYIVNLAGGRYPKTFMYVADSSFEYSVDMTNKRAFRVSAYNHFRPIWLRPAAVSTQKTEVLKVGGVPVECEVFEVKTDSSYTKIWASTQHRCNTSFYEKKKRAQANFLLPGLEGKVPIKTIKKEKGLTTLIEAAKISPRKFNAQQFTIPPDFKIQNRDNRW